MDTLNCIECFIRSAEAGSFAQAARRLGLTPAAVGKNVARLEGSLDVRLFQRSTRKLSLTEAGEYFLAEAAGGLSTLQLAMGNLTTLKSQPAGTLKVSMGLSFVQRYPRVVPDWHFDNRPVDLIADGFDAAVGGGFDLPLGVVARELAPAHRILLASKSYLETAPALRSPADLPQHAGILIRSPQTGRVRPWTLRNRDGLLAPIEIQPRMTLSDPEAACAAAQIGLGIALVSVAHALPYLEKGSVQRVLPDWYADTGATTLYFAGQKLLPQKTRVFVDFVVERFKALGLEKRLSALVGPAA
jgi:DNA-binding transcriptional LysR family regulator